MSLILFLTLATKMDFSELQLNDIFLHLSNASEVNRSPSQLIGETYSIKNQLELRSECQACLVIANTDQRSVILPVFHIISLSIRSVFSEHFPVNLH
jgi:hypothetical protein